MGEGNTIPQKARGGFYVVALCLVAFLFAATACSDADSDDPTAAEAGPGVTDESIKLGGFGPVSGPVESLGSNVRAGVEAYFESINADGGINGKLIDYVWVDDEFDPTKAAEAARQLVQQEEVLAVVGTMGGPNTFAAMPYLKQEDVPLIGPYSLTDVVGDYEQFPNTYQVFPDYGDQFVAMTEYAIDELGFESIATVTIEDPAGHAGADGTAEVLAERGMEPAMETSFLPVTQTDFASIVLQLERSGATAVTMLVTPAQTATVLKEAEKIGYEPTWLVDDAKQDPSFIAAAGELANDVYVASPVRPDLDPSAQDALEEALGPDTEPSYFVIAGWVMASLAAEGISAAEEPLSRASLYESLNSLAGWENGFTAPVSYGDDDRHGNNQLQILQIQDGEYVPVGEFIEVDR